MIHTSRRSVVKGTLAVGLAAGLPNVLAAKPGRPALFVFDARFDASRQMADTWRKQGVRIIDPRVADLGVAWRDTVPELLASSQRIDGATLWSDRFICETFGRDFGLQMTVGDRHPVSNASDLRHWILA